MATKVITQEDNTQGAIAAPETTNPEYVYPTIQRRQRTRKRGMMTAFGDTVSSGASSIEETMNTVENSLKIINANLRQTLAETIADGVKDLMAKGFTQEAAEDVMYGNNHAA